MTEVVIERLGHQGDGIARGPVFVPRALPGEEVAGDLDGDRLTGLKILRPSADRVAAPCPHYKSCGGCALQHASDDFVAAWKVEVVKTALSAHGLETPIRRLHTSPADARRRAVFSGRRTKKAALVGFHAPGSDVITPVPECHLVRPALKAALPLLQQLVQLGGSRKGEMRIAVTETETGLDVAISGGKDVDAALSQEIAALVEGRNIARVTWNDEALVTFVPPVLTFGSAPVTLPPGAFLQATTEGEAALLASVREAVGEADPVLDLFAGCGTFALPLALDAEVHAVEGEASMLAALDGGWRHASGAKKVTTETRDLFRRPLMPDELKRFPAVVIDPPRAGAEAQMIHLAEARPPRIVSVSCNPVTFARDSAILTAQGYRCDWIDVVDQFRWSPHVEIAACFTL